MGTDIELRGRRGRALKHGRMVAAVAMAGALVLGIAAPSSAESSSDLESGLWYFERGRVQAAHDAGFDGSGVTVAVIDSQINPDVIGLRGADIEVREPSYCFDEEGEPLPAVATDYASVDHGTNVSSMIVGTGEAPTGGLPIKGVAPGATLLFYNAAVPDKAADASEIECRQANGDTDLGVSVSVGAAISDAVDAGADVISISLTGTFDIAEHLAKAHAAGAIVVAGLPNDQDVASDIARANGVVAVQAFDAEGMIWSAPLIEGLDPSPRFTDEVIVAAPGAGILAQGTPDSWDAQTLVSGTSFATPLVAGFLAVVKQKYPDATAGQLIQSLIHNTGTKGEHEPEWNNSIGYGAVSMTGMLAVDPTKYPDVNPIFDAEDEFASPSAADVREAERELEAAASPAPTMGPAKERATPESTSPTWLPWAIGGGIGVALLVVAGVVLAFILSARSSRHRPVPEEHDRQE